MIQPVIALVPRQADQVSKLVRYCRDLDGTDLKVVPVDDSKFTPLHSHNELACRCAWSLRTVALEMKGKPFMWLEPDSIPLKAGWLKELEAEYHQAKKPFMLPLVSNGKEDVASGIGIYPAETSFLVPTDFKLHGWDAFIYKQLTPLVHFTTLIQHHYGKYEHGRVKYYHAFPRDLKMLRPEAVMFHKDGRQSLIPGHENVFAHSGDIGDLVAALPAMRQLGGGHIVICEPNLKYQRPRESMRGKRFDSIKPLLAAHPFIKSVTYNPNPCESDFDFSCFRQDYRPGENLARWQARFAGIDELDESPWIVARKSPESKGRVVIARSPRYHNSTFPWRKIVTQYGSKLLFVGLPDEHTVFEREFNCRVQYKRTENMKYLADLIAGADLFIGNQSSPAWVAMGLGQNLVMEVWPEAPNSMVQRQNARFIFEGRDY
jgi:hypothetical protein